VNDATALSQWRRRPWLDVAEFLCNLWLTTLQACCSLRLSEGSDAEEHVMADKPLSFEVPKEHADAIRKVAGNRQVRIMGKVQGNQLSVDFVACNAAFVACNTAFVACNSPFVKDK
jgi:hypothetical protein